MQVSFDTARRFSEAVARLHAAGSTKALAEAMAQAVNALFSSRPSEQRENWLRMLQGSHPSSIPPAIRGDLLLELLWTHMVQCHRQFHGESIAPSGSHHLHQSAPLTAREREVLACIALGQTDTAISQTLGIAPKTVSKHVEHILEKLGVETRTAAAATIYAPPGAEKPPAT